MKICIVTPAPAGSRKGNRITALRWTRIFRALGHRVVIAEEYEGARYDLLVALHAWRSAGSVERFRRQHPSSPLIVALTGTDLYGDTRASPLTRQSLELASRLVVLQPLAIAELPEALRERARVIYQSAERPAGGVAPAKGVFGVCVLAHLRPEKDPLRAAMAARLLPPSSRIRVTHLGAALSDEMGEAARVETVSNPRYRWLGEFPRWKALRVLARSRLLVLTSRMEGGASALSEALAASVPILSSRIPGCIGILGPDYPGYFAVEDTKALAALLARADEDEEFYQALRDCCERLRPLVDPARERESWEGLLRELGADREGKARSRRRERFRLIEAGEDKERAAFAHDVEAGLRSSPKYLPCRYFYDREGSRLFEAICELPEYYIPGAERQILRDQAAEIAGLLPGGTTLFELGSGSAAKTRILIEAFLRRQGAVRYVPVDISRAALEESSRALLRDYARLEIVAVAGEYEEGLQRLGALVRSPKLGLWLGSNIGNLDRPEAAKFLRRLQAMMSAHDRLLVGIDLRKDPAILDRAYDDSRGLTASFNRNILARINRELGGHFELETFTHKALYNGEIGRVEMYLVSTRAQQVRIDRLALQVPFLAGEAIHTENSYKYSAMEIEALVAAAGLGIERQWLDAGCRFSVSLLAPADIE